MGTVRSTVRTTLGPLARPSGPTWRVAVATGLAIGLMALVTPAGGADPRGVLERQESTSRSEQVTVPTRDEATAPPPEHGTAQGSPRFTSDLAAARDEESLARAALADLAVELDRATGVHSAALDVAEAAQDEMMRARVRLGDQIAAEDAAVSGLARAVAQVERTRAGSKARRSAFADWQMAAVAERAAHARRTVGEDIGAHLFRVLRSAEAALADAELARGKAQAAHLKAVHVADAASARLLELEAIASPRDTTPTGRTSTGAPSSTQAPASRRAVEQAQP